MGVAEETPHDGGARLFRRLLATFLCLSFIGWSGWALARDPCHPYGDLSCGRFTDHFSHMNMARLVTHAGIEIWTQPRSTFGRELSTDEVSDLPPDVRVAGHDARYIEGWSQTKPFVAGWQQMSSNHPPGALLLVSPVAAAYDYGSLSFTDANRWLIVLFLLITHGSLYLFARWRTEDGWSPVSLLVGFIVYGATIHVTLQGFYEAALIGPLVACAWFLLQRKGLHAIAAFSIAAFLHYRALLFLPWLAYGVFLVVRERQWKTWTGADRILAGVVTLVSVAWVGAFLLWLPTHAVLPISNPLRVIADDTGEITVLFFAVLVLVSVTLTLARAWPDLVTALWLFFMVILLPTTSEWNTITTLAWLGAPIVARDARWHLVRDVRIVAVLFLGVAIFSYDNLGIPTWITELA